MGKLVQPENGYKDPFAPCYEGRPPISQGRIDEYADCIERVVEDLPDEQAIFYMEGFAEKGYDLASSPPPPTVTQLQPVELQVFGSGIKFNFGSQAMNMGFLFILLVFVILGIMAWKGNLSKFVEAWSVKHPRKK